MIALRPRCHLYANREYAETVGIRAADFVGKTVADIFGEEAYHKLKPFGDRALAGESVEWEGWLNYPRLGNRYANWIAAYGCHDLLGIRHLSAFFGPGGPSD